MESNGRACEVCPAAGSRMIRPHNQERFEEPSMAEITGAQIVAKSLKQQGVEYMFGIVGIPVIPIAIHAQREGIKFLVFRTQDSGRIRPSRVSNLTCRPDDSRTDRG